MNARRENADGGKGDMMARWDPHQGRWVDDPPGRGSPWARTTAVIVLAALLGGAAGFGVWALARDDTKARTTSTDNSPSTPPASVSAAGPEDDTDSGSNGDGCGSV